MKSILPHVWCYTFTVIFNINSYPEEATKVSWSSSSVNNAIKPHHHTCWDCTSLMVIRIHTIYSSKIIMFIVMCNTFILIHSVVIPTSSLFWGAGIQTCLLSLWNNECVILYWILFVFFQNTILCWNKGPELPHVLFHNTEYRNTMPVHSGWIFLKLSNSATTITVSSKQPDAHKNAFFHIKLEGVVRCVIYNCQNVWYICFLNFVGSYYYVSFHT